MTVRSSYLLGADGARSAVRDAIGVTMRVRKPSPGISASFSVLPISPAAIHERAIMYWMVNEEVPAVLGPMDEAGLWTFMVTKLSDDAVHDRRGRSRWRGTG